MKNYGCVHVAHDSISSSSGWIFLGDRLKLVEANGSDESMRALLEPWISWSCCEVWGE